MGRQLCRYMLRYIIPTLPHLHRSRCLAGATAEDIADATKKLKHAGFDGVALDNGDGSFELVVFDPTAVKSATGNRGTYSPEEESILLSGQERESFKQAGFKLYVDPITAKDFYTSERDTAQNARRSRLITRRI